MSSNHLLLVCAGLAGFAPLVLADQMDVAAPVNSVSFGTSVTALPSGNIVVTDPDFANGAGVVYVYSPTGNLISTLTGSTADDKVGYDPDAPAIVVLANGNFVVRSPTWDAGATEDAGAVTWVNGVTGLPFGATAPTNVVSAANSLIGGADCFVGSHGVTALPSGHYVVTSLAWDNGTALNAGAVTWGNGVTGAVVGLVSAANSLIGSSTSDRVGSRGVFILANGNYVVSSPGWRNGTVLDAGAVTWGSGISGVRGVVSSVNSLVGSIRSDQVGESVTVLTNGHYVVATDNWDGPQFADVGAVTWASGTGGTVGPVAESNSLIGTSTSDFGSVAVIALSNGHFVVSTPQWRNGPVTQVGAATWGNGTKSLVGTISAANSLIGAKTSDRISSGGIVPLTNGNYVVVSHQWDGSTASDAGAATWGSGAAGVTGVVSSANSLVGTKTNDRVGNGGAVALSNGNYVVVSSLWRNGTAGSAGAVTWGDGATGIQGDVTAANSLCSDKNDDQVGSDGVCALTNGNYVVISPFWDNGAADHAGAVTWGNGTSGVKGLVSAANSMVGSSTDDNIGSYGEFGVVPLVNGNYVVVSPFWNNGAVSNAGAVTWATGAAPTNGPLSAANSLVGTVNSAQLGYIIGSNPQSVLPLPNGNYVINSPEGDPGGVANRGAVTWGNGATGVSGPLSAANSLVGNVANGHVGNEATTVLSNSRYIVNSSIFGTNGAVTLGDGNQGTLGTITSANSVLGVPPENGLNTVFTYNTHWQQLVVGQPDANLVSIFTFPAPPLEIKDPGTIVVADGWRL